MGVLLLKFDSFRCCGEGAEGSHGVLEVEYLGVAVVLVIHAAQHGIGIQHGLLCFHTVIFHQFACQTDPGTLMESADLCLRVGLQLAGSGLCLSGLDVELAFKNIGRAKGTYTGLIPLNGCQIINSEIDKHVP